MIVLFAPLEPRNIFIKVDGALRDYVRRGKIFLFTGYFWQHGGGASGPAVCVRDKGRGALFEEVAKSIHNETLLLDTPSGALGRALAAVSRSCMSRAGERVKRAELLLLPLSPPGQIFLPCRGRCRWEALRWLQYKSQSQF